MLKNLFTVNHHHNNLHLLIRH